MKNLLGLKEEEGEKEEESARHERDREGSERRRLTLESAERKSSSCLREEKLVSFSEDEGFEERGETYVMTMSWKLLRPFLSSMMLKEKKERVRRRRKERVRLRRAHLTRADASDLIFSCRPNESGSVAIEGTEGRGLYGPCRDWW